MLITMSVAMDIFPFFEEINNLRGMHKKISFLEYYFFLYIFVLSFSEPNFV